MNTRAPYLILFVITLAFRIATALPLERAGYMDASYAIHVAENLARGQGFVEQVLWNYLDNPTGLPHPSNLYWLPLPSLLIVPFFALIQVSYRVSQIPFIFLSSLLPLFTFYLARKIFARDDYAWTAALFTTFSGYFTIYWVSPDNFTPFALTASLCLFLIARGMETLSARYFILAGLCAALSHLARADAMLLLAIPPLALLVNQSTRSRYHVLRFTLYFLLAYLVLMSPWFLRNYLAVGTPYPSAGTKTLWLTSYDEVFRYTDDLTLQRYLAWGIDNIIGSKLEAAGFNLLVIVFGALQVFLTPFALIGLWQLRRRIEILAFMVYIPLLYLAMTLAFTFPSIHGSMLHSSGAVLPFLAVAVPPGIDAAIRWVARWRRTWDVAQASRVFRFGFIALAIFISVLVYARGVFPFGEPTGNIPLWNDRDSEYLSVEVWMEYYAKPDDLVMAVDPPSFYNLTRRRAIAVPTDSVDAVFQAAKRYGARYLVLQLDHPAPLNDLYNERVTIPGLKPVARYLDGVRKPVLLFEIVR